MKNLGQTDFGLFEMDFTALNTAHIQHIIDKRKQMIAGGENLA